MTTLEVVKHCEKPQDLAQGVYALKKPLKEGECVALVYPQPFPRGMYGSREQDLVYLAFRKGELVQAVPVRKNGIVQLVLCDTVLEAHPSVMEDVAGKRLKLRLSKKEAVMSEDKPAKGKSKKGK